MSQPSPYDKQNTYTGDLYTGADLDEDFDDIELTLDETLANLALIQRDDTRLANTSVHPDALDAATLALIASNFRPRGEWVTLTSYTIGDIVEVAATGSFVAVTTHVSGAVFATDKAAGKWVSLSGTTLNSTLTILEAATGAARIGSLPSSNVQLDLNARPAPVANIAALRAATTTTLPASYANVIGYYTVTVTGTPDGGGGLFTYDSTDVATADNGGTVIVDASGRRWKRQLTNGIWVKMFGAKGDGSTYDQPSIQAADTAAAALGVALFFSGGTWGINPTTAASALLQTTSWYGYKDTIKRLDFGTSTLNYTLIQELQSGLTLSGLTFDGQVTRRSTPTVPNSDPTAGTYVAAGDSASELFWTAVYGVVNRGGSNMKYLNCTFKNFLRAGLRLDDDTTGNPNPDNIIIDNCDFIRTRGIYGDGFINRGGTKVRISNCRAYDYQRIGFVQEFDTAPGTVDAKDIQMVNCIADYGHDSVSPENNAMYWAESVDNLLMDNCTGTYSGLGFIVNSTAQTGDGATRSFTSHIALNNCSANLVRLAGRLQFTGDRSVQLDVSNFFSSVYITGSATKGPVNSNFGGVPDGFQLSWNGTGAKNCVMNFSNIKMEMVDWGVYGTTSLEFGAICVRNAVASAPADSAQWVINVDGFQTQWTKSADGADDVVARTLYETSTLGHFGDFIVCGYQDYGAGTDYRARARINLSNANNHTFDYIMGAVQLIGTDSELNISDSHISLRRPNTRSAGRLSVNNCGLFDYRGDIGFADKILIRGSTIVDANLSSTDRSIITATNGIHHLSDNTFLRQFILDLGGGANSSNYKLRLKMVNNEFYIPFNTESGLNLYTGNQFASVIASNNTFRNNPTGAMGATKSMIECTQSNAGSIQFTGAGNAFDAAMVTAGGHAVQVNTTPTYNDAPQTVAAPFNTVFGALVRFLPI